MAEMYIVTKEELDSVADKIREKLKIADGLVFPNGFLESLANMSGGLPDVITAIDGGIYVPVNDAEFPISFTHNLGVLPKYAILTVGENILPYSSTSKYVYCADVIPAKWTTYSGTVNTNKGRIMYSSGSATMYLSGDATSVEFKSAADLYLCGGIPYTWILIA